MTSREMITLVLVTPSTYFLEQATRCTDYQLIVFLIYPLQNLQIRHSPSSLPAIANFNLSLTN